jgi:hypothetical protein
MRSVKEEEELELNKEVEGRREEGKTYVVNTYKVHNTRYDIQVGVMKGFLVKPYSNCAVRRHCLVPRS